ncbi:tyrosine-type recombinase/integrase [Agrobacterium rhizogenes]|uniref:tyrosine-type recombinase/integrase n=1 Tax=Rhizobium rhizogenes TaxID=359 RepID=UPI001574B522|nr:tyrosine-type recombinase/integrase [Rhizobium rhizogenes]NTH29783.1 tyrosine-type recombinase/integrase [Rhizobium rhizogenes]
MSESTAISRQLHHSRGHDLPWNAIEPWHIQDLYREQMIQGYWTQEFWVTGNLFSLNFPTTIKGRLAEAAACCAWMAKQGLIEWWQSDPPLTMRQKAAQSAVTALSAAIPSSFHSLPPEPKYKRRQDPGDWSPLTVEELRAIFDHIDRPVGALVALFYLKTGIRLQELVNNSLVAGAIHIRSHIERRMAYPRFPKSSYRLKYDLRDERMVGVLPDAEAAFSSVGLLPYRIMGKGNKIRTIYLPPSFVRELWRYFELHRPKITGVGRSYLFLNKWNRPLTARNVAYIISKAKRLAEKALGLNIVLTPHVLRHTFACLFIESTISERAKEEGFDTKKLTQKQVEDFGSEALVVLQKLLGHALPKDTLRYLRQLSLGRIGLRYLEFFSSAMKEVLGPDASF